MRLPRPVVFLGALTTIVLVIVLFGTLLVPRLIDSRLIRDKISSELLSKSHGSVIFGKIDFRWFPRPYLIIENAEASFDASTQVSIRSAEIYPSFFYLLTGRWVLRRALLLEPKLTMRLPDSPAKAFDLDELEKQIRSGLVRFTSALPTAQVEVSQGSAEITIGDKPRLILENVAAQTVASPGALRFGLSARSNLCEQIKVDGKMVIDSLASEINIGLRKLEIRDVLALLALDGSVDAKQGAASLAVHMTSVGLRQFRAAVDGSVGPFVVARHGGAATIEAKRLKAGISYRAGDFEVEVEQLDLGSPRLQASGELKFQSGRLSTRIQVRDADVAQLSDLALRIAADHEPVRIAQRYASAGTIPEITIQSAGASFAKLISSKNLVVSGSLRGWKIFIPGPDLELTNVTGSAQFSNGILEADGVSANLGATKGWNGKLKLGLEEKTAPFHLDILLNAGAAEVQSVLLKVVRDDPLRDELVKLEKVEGELSGRLILGERLDAIAPIVAISKADIRANYAPIPFPVAIRGGRFSYDRSLIRLENAQASVGRSRFGALGVTFHRDGSRKMTVDAQPVSLDLQQMDRCFAASRNCAGILQVCSRRRVKSNCRNWRLPASMTSRRAGSWRARAVFLRSRCSTRTCLTVLLCRAGNSRRARDE